MTGLNLQELSAAVEHEDVALVRISATYQAGGGEGSRVFPPSFPMDPGDTTPYLFEKRVRGGEQIETVVLDQVPSQANRVEEALARAQQSGRVELPLLRIRHDGAVPLTLTGLELPHRGFDAYLRDTTLDGVAFDRTTLGKSFQAASLSDATALLRHDPGTLAFGGWNSHRKGRQAKFPRIYASEIVGWHPLQGARRAGRMDPVNLSGGRSGDGDDWTYTPVSSKKKEAKLSEIGHGNVRPNKGHGGVTVSSASRFATLSFAALRRIRFGSTEPSAQLAGRTLLAAYALLGDRLAFGGGGVWLRSGCDLVLVEEAIEWVGRGNEGHSFELSADEAVALFVEAQGAAEEAGIGFALEPVELVPKKALADAIDYTLTKAELAEAEGS